MTIKKIAELAGVSTATVSYVINNTKNISPETRKRVQAAIEECGYQPNNIAKSLRMKTTNTIGVIVEDILGFSVPQIINGISEYVEGHGYQILLYDLKILEKLYNQYDTIIAYKAKINAAVSFLLNSAKVDAIIFVSMFDRDVTGIIDDIDKTLVYAYSVTQNPADHFVTYDSELISYEVIQYLYQNGHRNIGIITGQKDSYPTEMRMRGIRKACDELGICLDASSIKFGEWDIASGYNKMTELLRERGNLTAVFAMNDIMAAGAMDAIREAGLSVPEDISLIGFDNREISDYLRPRLTTVEIDLKQIGLRAAEVAINKIRKLPAQERGVIIPSKLIIRQTVQAV